MKTTLIIPFYTDKSKERNEELIKCYERNLACTELDEIVLVIDDNTKVKRDSKVTIKYVQSRPTYIDLFKIANMHNNNGVSIIANTDIYFDDINLIKLKHTISEDMCFALSRWDEDKSGEYIHHNSRDSQDVWVFKGHINTQMDGDFFMGLPGCDNRIAYEIGKAGYAIRNPSITIKSYHLHLTQVHNYERTEKFIVPMPYRLLPPTTIDKMSDVHYLITANGITKMGRDIDEPEEQKPKAKGLDQYTLQAQKDQIDFMFRSYSIPKRFTLSIIILYTKKWEYHYEQLFKELNRQRLLYGLQKRVQIFPVVDTGILPIGWKRNYGNINCAGRYVWHVDVDDWVSDTALKDIFDVLDSNSGLDCITFDSEYTHDGERPQKMTYNACFKENNATELPSGNVLYTRMPSHINVMKREIQLMHPFNVLGKVGLPRHTRVDGRSDSGTDVQQSHDIVASGAIKKHYHIDKTLYHYRYKDKKEY